MAEQEAAVAAPRSRIFISYSRKDVNFVDRLAGALKTRGYDAFLDREEVSGGEAWKERLEQLLLQADAVAFVISPDSMASPICDWETNRTIELGKRLIPLLWRPVEVAQVPEQLARLNYIYFDADEKFDDGLSRLCGACDLDIAWVREHSRLTARAEEWSKASESGRNAKLLRGVDIPAAQAWVNRRPGPAAPAISDMLASYLDASAAYERSQSDELGRRAGLAFVAPAAQAFEEGLYDKALRLTAAGVLLGGDWDMTRVPEHETVGRFRRAAFEDRTIAICRHEGPVRTAAFSHDGTLLHTSSDDQTIRTWAVATGQLRTSSNDQTVQTLAVVTGEQLHEFKDAKGIFHCTLTEHDRRRLHHDNASFTVAGPDIANFVHVSREAVELHSVITGRDTILRAPEVDNVVFSPDGRRFVMTSWAGSAVVWDTAGKKLARFGRRERRIAAFSPDSALVIAVSPDGVFVRKAATGAKVSRVRGRLAKLISEDDECRVALDSSGARLATASSATTSIWNVKNGVEAAILAGHKEPISAIAFSPDGARVLTASGDGTARVWSAASGAELLCLRGHEEGLTAAAFTPDGAHIVTASTDGSARVWDASLEANAIGLKARGCRSVISPDGKRMVTYSASAPVCIWDAIASTMILRLDEERCTSAKFSPDGSRIVFQGGAASFRLRDATNGTRLATMPRNEGGERYPVVFSPDSARVATIAKENVHVWDARTGGDLACIRGIGRLLTRLSFSPDGRRLATCQFALLSEPGIAQIWDAVTGAELARMVGHENSVTDVAFSPDGNRIVTTSSDQSGRIWDASTGAELLRLSGHSGVVETAAFSPDGKRIVTTSSSGSARVWDATSGAQIAQLMEGAFTAAFSPDSDRILTYSLDGSMRIWDAASGAEIACLKSETCESAQFSIDGMQILPHSTEGARIWCVARSIVLSGPPLLVLAAGLAAGRGRRTAKERGNLPMRDAPDDLFAALTERMPEELRANVLLRAQILAMPHFPNP